MGCSFPHACNYCRRWIPFTNKSIIIITTLYTEVVNCQSTSSLTKEETNNQISKHKPYCHTQDIYKWDVTHKSLTHKLLLRFHSLTMINTSHHYDELMRLRTYQSKPYYLLGRVYSNDHSLL